MCQNWSHVSADALRNVPAKGMSTIRLRYVSVYPRESPNPGRMLRFLKVMAKLFPFYTLLPGDRQNSPRVILAYKIDRQSYFSY